MHKCRWDTFIEMWIQFMIRGDGNGGIGVTEQSFRWKSIHTSRERNWHNWQAFQERSRRKWVNYKVVDINNNCQGRRRLGDDWKYCQWSRMEWGSGRECWSTRIYLTEELIKISQTCKVVTGSRKTKEYFQNALFQGLVKDNGELITEEPEFRYHWC